MDTEALEAFPYLIRVLSSRFESILWIDSSNAAKTHYFEDSPELLDKVSVARVFTALQHHQLCKEVEGYDLIVLPEIDRLYAESSLYETEAGDLFTEAVKSIQTTVVYSTVGEHTVHPENVLEIDETSEGLNVSGRDSSTKMYPVSGGVQTTVNLYSEAKKEWEEPTARIETG